MAATKVHHRAQDAEDLQAINDALDSLFSRGTFASREPYVNSIAQKDDFVYRHRNRYQERQFAHGMPFARDDPEELQYLTYRYYEPGKTQLTQYPCTIEQSVKPAINTNTSSNSTPAGPKKVISLKDYKRQKLGSSPVRRPEGAVSTIEEERIQNDNEDILASLDEPQEELASVTAASDTSATKRKRTDTMDEPVKRPRLEDTQETQVETQQLVHDDTQQASETQQTYDFDFSEQSPEAGQSEPKSRDLPRKLSPLAERAMPSRVSPTLPDSVQKALNHRKELKERRLNGDRRENGNVPSRASNENSGLDSDQSPPRRLSKIVKLPVKTSSSATGTTGNRIRSPPPSRDQPGTPRTALSPELQRLSTPGMRKSLAQNGVTHTPEPNTPDTRPRSAKSNHWAAEQKRLDSLGRGFKHAATKCSAAGAPDLAAVKALQSAMCYFMAFTCGDQLATKTRDDLHTWRSLVPFFKFVIGHCERYPALLAVAWMLCQVGNQHLEELVIGLPEEPQPISVKSLLLIMQLSRQATAEAVQHMTAARFRQDFPGAAEAAVEVIAHEELKAGQLLNGDYQYPATRLTTPVQAVRAAVAIVSEWIEQHDLSERIELEP